MECVILGPISIFLKGVMRCRLQTGSLNIEFSGVHLTGLYDACITIPSI